MNIFNHQINPMQTIKCLIIKCEDEVQTRGLCAKCYSTARMMMASGKITEQELLDKGMILPARPKVESRFKAELLGL